MLKHRHTRLHTVWFHLHEIPFFFETGSRRAAHTGLQLLLVLRDPPFSASQAAGTKAHTAVPGVYDEVLRKAKP